jgi:hypothetical protein
MFATGWKIVFYVVTMLGKGLFLLLFWLTRT